MSSVVETDRTIHFVSLGCPKNRVDSEVMLGVAERAGFRHVAAAEEASVIVVNTCGFIDAAKKESIDTILELSGYKDSGSCQKLVVSGCLSQRYPEDLAKDLGSPNYRARESATKALWKLGEKARPALEATAKEPQRSLTANTTVEAAYVGSKITHVGLPDTNLNQLSVEQLALGTELTKRVTNPFFGIVPRSSSLGDPTIPVGQLMKPYPEYTTVSLYRNNVGTTLYQGLELSLRQRFTHGLSYSVAYTRSIL